MKKLLGILAVSAAAVTMATGCSTPAEETISTAAYAARFANGAEADCANWVTAEAAACVTANKAIAAKKADGYKYELTIGKFTQLSKSDKVIVLEAEITLKNDLTTKGTLETKVSGVHKFNLMTATVDSKTVWKLTSVTKA